MSKFKNKDNISWVTLLLAYCILFIEKQCEKVDAAIDYIKSKVKE
jgi:hypothetical protein